MSASSAATTIEPASEANPVPRGYNAASDFIDRHVSEGRAAKPAVIDEAGTHSYGALAEQVNRAANALLALGLRPEERVVMVMLDTCAFPAAFWGAIKAGIVPVPVNTLLTTETYREILADSRARAVVVSDALLDKVAPALEGQRYLEHVVVDGEGGGAHARLRDLLAKAPPEAAPAPTTCDDVAFWLYSSGTTGAPKGVRHLHAHLRHTAELYGKRVLGIREDDVVFSAAKLFFAYGLGNAMTFPFSVGATTVLLAGRPTPEAAMAVLRDHQPTIFYGVPTLFAAILADAGNNRESGSQRLRRCVSAGEALPAEVGRRWEERFGAEILDGVGSTEMLHIFLSNRPGAVHYGTSGTPVPGYEAKLVDEKGQSVAPGEIGELLINGPSAAADYWNQRQKSLDTFMGRWTRTNDKYYVDDEGLYHYCGRSDDMMKVGGNWVSPFEVESALISHEAVVEAAVVPKSDEHGLIKPKAFVVLRDGAASDGAQAEALQAHVKVQLAPWKYPRWIAFVDSLPKTATGKIQRFKLRALEED